MFRKSRFSPSDIKAGKSTISAGDLECLRPEDLPLLPSLPDWLTDSGFRPLAERSESEDI
jgi:hypothetical protein